MLVREKTVCPQHHFTALTLSLTALIAALGIAWTVSAAAAPHPQLTVYRSDQWHFAIAVPADMKVDESEHRQAEQIIQFNDGNGRWFSVVAAPYTQLDVGTGKEGAPDTNTDQSTTLGVVNVYRDNLYSVSFHRNGIAYSVTTESDESWLLPILQSWEFTE